MPNNNQIKILFLSADPSDATRLRLGQELRDIQEKLQLAKQRDNFVLEQRMSVRPGDISQALLDVEPEIVHFSGHGTLAGTLCFENESGKTQPILPSALAALFSLLENNVECVVLNACYSEAQAKAIAQHIPFVIGMNRAIGDKAAIAFSVGFYKAIVAGRSIEDAFKFGCTEIQLWNIPEHLTPTLVKKSASEVETNFESDVPALEPSSQIWKFLSQLPTTTRFNGNLPDPRFIFFTFDGQTLISVHDGHKVCRWDSDTEKLLDIIDIPFSFSTHSNNSISISPDGQIFVCIGHYKSNIELFDLKNRGKVNTFSGTTDKTQGTSSVTISFDGQTLVSGGHDGAIKIWHLHTGELLRTIFGHSGSINAITLNPSGQTIVSSSHTEIKLWDLSTGNLLLTLSEHSDRVSSILVSPDGSLIISSDEKGKIVVWSIRTGKILSTLSGHISWVRATALNSDGQVLFSGGRDKTIKVWNIYTGELIQTLTGHWGHIYSIASGSDGVTIASCSSDGVIKIWSSRSSLSDSSSQFSSTKSAENTSVSQEPNWHCTNTILEAVSYIAIASNNHILISKGTNDRKGLIKLRDLKTTNLLYELSVDDRDKVIFISPDEHFFIVKGSKKLSFHRFSTGELFQTVEYNNFYSSFVSVSPDGQILAKAGQEIQLFKTQTGDLIRSFGKPTLMQSFFSYSFGNYSLALISLDGKILLSNNTHGAVHLWNIETGELIHTLTKGYEHFPGYSRDLIAAFSKDMQTLATVANSKSINLWNLDSGKSTATLHGHRDTISCISISPDGNILASGSKDETIRLWNLNTRKLMCVLTEHTERIDSLSFSSDNKLLVSCNGIWGDKSIKIWKLIE